MHGSGLTHIVWSLHEQFLASKGYSILSVDLPGHGSSEGPAIRLKLLINFGKREANSSPTKQPWEWPINEISLIFNFSINFLIHSAISSIDFMAGPSEVPCPGKSTD